MICRWPQILLWIPIVNAITCLWQKQKQKPYRSLTLQIFRLFPNFRALNSMMLFHVDPLAPGADPQYIAARLS